MQPGYWQRAARSDAANVVGRARSTRPNRLAKITAPTLLIAGERDSFGHIDQQIVMHRAMPHSQLCILPTAGHDVMNDQPELFRIAALDFLQRVENI